MKPERVNDFFAFARERHDVYLRRRSGLPPPWTEDPILLENRFTNVYRELDATTVWFRENVRNRLRDTPEVLLATVVFRWFNKTEIGQIVFQQPDLMTNRVPWEHFLEGGRAHDLSAPIRRVYPDGPWVTGSYMIRSPDGMDKLNGVSRLCADFHNAGKWRDTADRVRDGLYNLESFTNLLAEIPFLGGFLAYEITTDLRHTALLENAPDIMTWANPGPGAQRGLNYLSDRQVRNPRKPTMKYQYNVKLKSEQTVAEMRELLELSRLTRHWPSSHLALEMRDIEHTLCEYFKYIRVRVTGQGTRRRFTSRV
jgi:hypothetical protein